MRINTTEKGKVTRRIGTSMPKSKLLRRILRTKWRLDYGKEELVRKENTTHVLECLIRGFLVKLVGSHTDGRWFAQRPLSLSAE